MTTKKKRSPPLRTKTLSELIDYWDVIRDNLHEYEWAVADYDWQKAAECKAAILHDLPAVRRLTNRLFKHRTSKSV